MAKEEEPAERCDTSRVIEATKGATKASRYSPVDAPKRCIHFSNQGAVQRSTTFTQGWGKLHNLEAPNYTMMLDRESSHQSAQQQEFPQQETPYKDPHKGDLGLPGFPMETASIRNPFGGKVDQLLLKIPGGIAKI